MTKTVGKLPALREPEVGWWRESEAVALDAAAALIDAWLARTDDVLDYLDAHDGDAFASDLRGVAARARGLRGDLESKAREHRAVER